MLSPRCVVLSSMALGLAPLLLAPSEEAAGFDALGFTLGLDQRDFRVFDGRASGA